jgi:hypothetical protein
MKEQNDTILDEHRAMGNLIVGLINEMTTLGFVSHFIKSVQAVFNFSTAFVEHAEQSCPILSFQSVPAGFDASAENLFEVILQECILARKIIDTDEHDDLVYEGYDTDSDTVSFHPILLGFKHRGVDKDGRPSPFVDGESFRMRFDELIGRCSTGVEEDTCTAKRTSRMLIYKSDKVYQSRIILLKYYLMDSSPNGCPYEAIELFDAIPRIRHELINIIESITNGTSLEHTLFVPIPGPVIGWA